MAAKKVVSIQAERNKRGHKRSHVATLNDETLKHAYNHGLPWADEDVESLAGLIDQDKTTFDMAMHLGRSYYSTQYARAHISFALRHANVFKRIVK